MKHKGIDISQWQGEIDFKKVKEAGYSIVYIKSGEGSDSTDPFFEKNYQKAYNENLKIGFYHCATARSTNQSKHQARFFASLTSNKKYDCPLAINFEDFWGLTRHEMNRIGIAFIDALQELTNSEPIVYSGYSNTSHFSVPITFYPLWISDYSKTPPTDLNNWSSYIGWQYTNKGSIPGIAPSVNVNLFYSEIFLPQTHNHKTPARDYYPFLETTIRYRVRKGDTLTKIARLYHTNVAELVKVNHIENKNLIYINQILKIPIDDEQKSSDIYLYYTIQSHDTLFSIAEKYNTTVTELVKSNLINTPNLIYPGQILKILRPV